MDGQDQQAPARADGAAATWILEHLFTYPGTYELPLRTMYTLNSASSHPPSPTTSTSVAGNAFPSPSQQEQQHSMSTAIAAAQLRANLMSHIAQQPSQPQSLPPSFITTFVRKCFAVDLAQVDFPQALTALDYLKDLETRRRNEVLAALTHLGISKTDVADREVIAKATPRVYEWMQRLEEKEVKVEILYTHVYLGLRRWTLVNEMMLQPFNKQNCLAMLNTLYPPMLHNSQSVMPTTKLTQGLLSEQRKAFFRYIQAVEKSGSGVLQTVMSQHARPREETGWPKVREDLDNYIRMANAMIEECLETTGRLTSPQSASFSFQEHDEQKRKVDSGISFGSGYPTHSNRSSGQSHVTRPSTSSSISNHTRNSSKDQSLDHTTRSFPAEEQTVTVRPAASALERIARELRRFGSKSNLREQSQ
ncbi:hypothetical protein LTR66_015984, partial [Elasticomyces elasticus]